MCQTVAVTGMGIVSSLGEGTGAFRDALLRGQSNFSTLSYPILSFPVLAAAIQDFSFSRALQTFNLLTVERRQQLEKIARPLPVPVQVALIAAMEAWQKAEMNRNAIAPERVGLVVAAQNTSCHYQYDLHDKFVQQPDYLSPSYAINFMDTNYVGVLSEVFGILGEGFTVGGSSACGNVAILRGWRLIRDGWQDACLVVGAVADLSPMELQGFHNLGALGGHRFASQPDKACRPFDKAHEGFIYGQAAACLMLESVQSALNRNVPILGYISGGALTLDGNRLSNPNREGEIRVMREAIKVAGVAVENIDYINTHGTSAPLGDKTEIEAIETLLGKRSLDVKLNSTKSITGHCLWSAGIVEAIATIIQMQEGFIHPSLNLEDPITKDSQFVTGEKLCFQSLTALSNSFGFGGINTSLVFTCNSTKFS